MHKYTVLIVEDEKNINEFISKTLVSNGYRTNWAASGKEAVSLATSLCPDVILLDLGLPDIDGMEVIRQVRDWSRCPILVISARTEEEDKVNALDAGADDYLTKPFGTSELLARIRTSLRHSAQNSSSPQQLYQAKGLEIDFLRRIVSLNGQPVHLTPIEYKIVAHLARNSGRVVTYTDVISSVWGPYAENDNKILRVNMANIRRKLEASPAQPAYIFTEVGIGYRMLDDESAVTAHIPEMYGAAHSIQGDGKF